EQRIAAALSDVVQRKSSSLALSNEQLDAIRTAARSPLALISGGPGTGKTSIVVAMLRVFARLGIDVYRMALAAPTGRAAYRMSEAIHSALAGIEDPSPEDQILRNSVLEAATIHNLA